MTDRNNRNYFEGAKDESGKRHDVRERCGLFKMTAATEEDEIMLSHLYRCLWLIGGTITIETPDRKETYNIPDH